MFVSTRRRFRRGDRGWDEYVRSVNLPHLAEVRTIDSALNRYVHGAGDIDCSPQALDTSLPDLPAPIPGEEYHLLAINLDTDPAGPPPPGWRLLGYDLADRTQTSSLLNCGTWTGRLAPLTERLNGVGLLSRDDAALAQRLLPQEWGEGMDHAHPAIWALYERE